MLAGYDNGDLKLFDLRMGLLRWETALGNGVCGVQFDRRGIAQNKFAAACLESQYHVFDARTLHPDQVSRLSERAECERPCQAQLQRSPAAQSSLQRCLFVHFGS